MAKKKKQKKNELAPRDDETPQARLKRLAREKKAADMRYKLARLEAGEDDDEDEDEAESAGLVGPTLDGGIGGLGQLVKRMNEMGVEDTTPGNAEGGPGFKFHRHAGTVRGIKLDRHGRPIEVDFKPEEWPPRGESF